MYWFLGPDYRNNNELEAERPLLPLFTDPNKTQMNCIKETVSDINERAWVHHNLSGVRGLTSFGRWASLQS